ncbi:MAG: NAD-dependent epimerase/dehydratase family protein [Candidatus Dormibacteria bacterium]
MNGSAGAGLDRPILLTGASGFVGHAVMEDLLRSGYRVRALVRCPERFSSPEGVETFPGDVTDLQTVVRAGRDCQAAIHCAADYRLALRPGEESRMIATNVGGTANVLEAAARCGLRRVVHCSTVGTLAFERSGRVLTESDLARSPSLLPGPYKRSKWAAEWLCLKRSPQGVAVVVVQPSTPVGGGDRKPTPTGQMVRDFLLGRLPAYVETGLNVVAVEAVARGHVLALERGVPGRSYILGDRNLSLRQFFQRLAQIAGRKAPRWRIPISVGLAAAALSELEARLRDRPPKLPLTSVRMARHPMYVDARRARDELGWSPGALDEALRRAVAELGPS